MDPDLLKLLDDQAIAICDTVKDDPEKRYDLRKSFYERFGFGTNGSLGYGTSELAFMRWEINRGVLNPATMQPPGSEWWRYVNWHFLYHGTLAVLLFDKGIAAAEVTGPSRMWLNYMYGPSPQTWYAAHNASITHGYYFSLDYAKDETEPEQLFMRQVLIRLLYAQMMVMDQKCSMGLLGEFLANPKDDSVEDMIHIPDFYPDHYPLTATDILMIEYKEVGLMDWIAKFFDMDLIGPHITQIFNSVAEWIEFSPLTSFVLNRLVTYPLLDTIKTNINERATTA